MSHHLTTSILFIGTLSLEWEESPLVPDVQRLKLEKQLLDQATVPDAQGRLLWLITLGLSPTDIPLSPALSFWRDIVAGWIHQVRTDPESDNKRDSITVPLDEATAYELCSRMPPMIGSDQADASFFKSIWDDITQAFRTGISGFKGSVDDFFNSLTPNAPHIDRIHFHMVENRNDTERPFAFLATYTTRIDKHGKTRHQPLRHALEEFAGNSRKMFELLATVNKIAKDNSLIHSMVESGDLFRMIGFTADEAFAFLEGVTTFEAAGILCRIPRWWKKGPRQAAITLSLGSKTPSRVGSDALLNFKPSLTIDGETLSEKEIQRLLERADSLVFIKGKWVPVDLDSLRKTLDDFKNAKKKASRGTVSFAEALKLIAGIHSAEAKSALPKAEIKTGDWLASILEKMANPNLIRTTSPAPRLKAHLRHYQQAGLNWLGFMYSLGFGVCLADDMGLGKTVQMLAHLQKLRKKDRTSLIIVPASLLENWRTEITRFTPDISFVIIHPQAGEGVDIDALEKKIHRYDCAITTYGMIRRCGWISRFQWFYVVCDEAQAIKNPGTAQTKAVKALHCSFRCAMTGTPVENRLSDLWSIFDFINPGLLGSFSAFRQFIKNIDSCPEGYGRLRSVVRPYILRRSKTDKTIINDLPEKVELKTWCTLSKQQTILYRRLVDKLDDELSGTTDIKRKGIILNYLIRFKQLCNHPDHYTGENGEFSKHESGKLQRLAELCLPIAERREQMLIFTQFAEIVPPLSRFLQTQFGYNGVTITGATSVANRRKAVETFQSDTYVPFFILSLKAGGVGLNLTAANHVVHFDRWWNPAVENQATDRAFRIGQKKSVMVHKFICKGTVEERIDLLIDDKKQLADKVVSTAGEKWITEFDDTRIKEMFKLTIDSAHKV